MTSWCRVVIDFAAKWPLFFRMESWKCRTHLFQSHPHQFPTLFFHILHQFGFVFREAFPGIMSVSMTVHDFFDELPKMKYQIYTPTQNKTDTWDYIQTLLFWLFQSIPFCCFDCFKAFFRLYFRMSFTKIVNHLPKRRVGFEKNIGKPPSNVFRSIRYDYVWRF